MRVFAYLGIGLLVGAIFQQIKKMRNTQHRGLMSTTFLGAVGATTAGLMWDLLLEHDSTSALEWSSLFVATIGACLTFGVLHLIQK